MSTQSLAKIANIKSPSDFLRAVMGRSGKCDINREDILGALANHRDKLGQHLLYYWLYEDQQGLAIEQAERVTIGYWLHCGTTIEVSREKLEAMAAAAVSQVMRYQDTRKLIAMVNDVTPNAITMNPKKYRPQIEFLQNIHTTFNNSLFKAKLCFLSHFFDENN